MFVVRFHRLVRGPTVMTVHEGAYYTGAGTSADQPPAYFSTEAEAYEALGRFISCFGKGSAEKWLANPEVVEIVPVLLAKATVGTADITMHQEGDVFVVRAPVRDDVLSFTVRSNAASAFIKTVKELMGCS